MEFEFKKINITNENKGEFGDILKEIEEYENGQTEAPDLNNEAFVASVCKKKGGGRGARRRK